MPTLDDFEEMQQRILVVDVDEQMARSIKRILKRNGFEVSIANNGFMAGALLGSFQPSLITLDLQMPGMDVFEVLNYLQQQENKIKTLVISGLQRSDLQRAVESGADAVLSKHFR